MPDAVDVLLLLVGPGSDTDVGEAAGEDDHQGLQNQGPDGPRTSVNTQCVNLKPSFTHL